jgi:hypothetical protein
VPDWLMAPENDSVTGVGVGPVGADAVVEEVLVDPHALADIASAIGRHKESIARGIGATS